MRPGAVCLVAASVGVLSSVGAVAQPTSVGLIPETEARRYGLERAWVTQVELDPSRARVTHLSAWVSTEEVTTVFDVHYDGRKKSFKDAQIGMTLWSHTRQEPRVNDGLIELMRTSWARV